MQLGRNSEVAAVQNPKQEISILKETHFIYTYKVHDRHGHDITVHVGNPQKLYLLSQTGNLYSKGNALHKLHFIELGT